LHLELAKADGSGVSPGAGADHDCVKTLLGHGFSYRNAFVVPTAPGWCEDRTMRCAVLVLLVGCGFSAPAGTGQPGDGQPPPSDAAKVDSPAQQMIDAAIDSPIQAID